MRGKDSYLQNHIRYHSFELILSDQQIIGQRRAAQMLMASALKVSLTRCFDFNVFGFQFVFTCCDDRLQKLDAGAADDVVKAALDTELEVLSKQE